MILEENTSIIPILLLMFKINPKTIEEIKLKMKRRKQNK